LFVWTSLASFIIIAVENFILYFSACTSSRASVFWLSSHVSIQLRKSVPWLSVNSTLIPVERFQWNLPE